MSDVDDAIALLLIHVYLKNKEIKKRENKIHKKKAKRIWVREWLLARDLPSYKNMLKTSNVTTDLKNLLGIDETIYTELLSAVSPLIKRKDTLMRDAITPTEKLVATLKYLATGISFEELTHSTHISAQSLGRLAIETCEALILCLKDYIHRPNNADEWQEVASEFANKWNFSNCIGAIGGKHVQFHKPKESAGTYYNYNKTFSFVMMVLVNAKFEFMAVEVGTRGSLADDVFSKSKLKEEYDEGLLNLPEPVKIKRYKEVLPYVMVGDDAFPLLGNLMTPYTHRNLTNDEKVFNYRLSRAHDVVENTFSILSNRFRVLQKAIKLSPEKVSTIALACCYLHNYLMENVSVEDNICEERDSHFLDLENLSYDYAPINAINIRNKFCKYFNTVGKDTWQNSLSGIKKQNIN